MSYSYIFGFDGYKIVKSDNISGSIIDKKVKNQLNIKNITKLTKFKKLDFRKIKKSFKTIYFTTKARLIFT